ncbi:MAG TPA: hypothetical protein VNN23_07985 [Ornithinibacter sp.]|nr:hypothetical protein [Ornithinibacter sp.]
MGVNVRTRGRWGLPLVAALLLVAACDGSGSGSDDGAPAAGRVTTTDVALPAGDEPVVVTPWGDDLLVGSRAPEGSASRPRLTVLDPAGGSHEVAVTPVSPTAFQAKWLVAAPRGTTVDLVGGAPAGAHSNTRWSTWRGDTAAVRELPQPFATFGGWGAGALVSLVQTPSSPVVVGSWESGGAGLDIALWHPHGERWVRAPSAGTPLASSASALVSARGATADRGGLLVVGSVTLLGNGSVGQRPAVWRAPGPDGPWTRTDLPGDGSLGEAHAATCDEAGRCTVVGEVDGTLRGWTLAADDTVTALPVPALAVGEHDLLTAPLLRGGESTVLLASGGVLRVLTVSGDGGGDGADGGGADGGGDGADDDGGGEVDGIRERTGPPARAVRSAARTDTGDYVVLEDPSGAARLVRLSAP